MQYLNSQLNTLRYEYVRCCSIHQTIQNVKWEIIPPNKLKSDKMLEKHLNIQYFLGHLIWKQRTGTYFTKLCVFLQLLFNKTVIFFLNFSLLLRWCKALKNINSSYLYKQSALFKFYRVNAKLKFIYER